VRNKIKTAFATNDGETYNNSHFGDADYYDLYDVDSQEAVFLERIPNTIDEEQTHADPNKAKGIVGLLSNYGVSAVVSKVFGPNIKRIKNKFVCILMNNATIDESLIFLSKHLLEFHKEWQDNIDKKYFDLRQK
jgi:predicted Fe-Mo cluster-binding NifX family protein